MPSALVVVSRTPCRHEHGKARFDRRTDTIENGFACPLLHPKELIEFVHFHPDLLPGLQRHYNQLTVPGRVKHMAKIFILDSDFFDVLYETFPDISSS